MLELRVAAQAGDEGGASMPGSGMSTSNRSGCGFPRPWPADDAVVSYMQINLGEIVFQHQPHKVLEVGRVFNQQHLVAGAAMGLARLLPAALPCTLVSLAVAVPKFGYPAVSPGFSMLAVLHDPPWCTKHTASPSACATSRVLRCFRRGRE